MCRNNDKLVLNLAECAKITTQILNQAERAKITSDRTVGVVLDSDSNYHLYQTLLFFLLPKAIGPFSVLRAELDSKQGRHVRREFLGRLDFQWRKQAICDRTTAA